MAYPNQEPATVAPGAKERIEKKLKDLKEINEKRPCKKCVYRSNNSLMTCKLVSGGCDFYHSKFEPILEPEKTEEVGSNDI